MSNHSQMLLQRQHILLSYFKTLSVGLVWGSNPGPPEQESSALPVKLPGQRFAAFLVSHMLPVNKVLHAHCIYVYGWPFSMVGCYIGGI